MSEEMEFLYKVADLVAAAKHLGLDVVSEMLEDYAFSVVMQDGDYTDDEMAGFDVRQAATRERLAATGMLA